MGLILTNCLTVAYMLSDKKSINASSDILDGKEEVVAKVGNENITRETWLLEIEKKYGKDVLEGLINQKIVKKLKEKYKISIDPIEVERELRMLKIMYSGTLNGETFNEKEWEEQIENNLVIEEIITKDVSIDKKEIEEYYEQNKMFYNFPDYYHLSHIVVRTLDEAQQIVGELEKGGNFQTLAMEWSVDPLSATSGGNIGFIAEGDEHYPEKYVEEAKKLKANHWSNPIKTDIGYAIIFLHEHVKGVHYSFDQMKNQIRRQIALKQLDAPMSIRHFWDEIGVHWFYGDTNG
jgi:foldase protein PrsA